MFACGPSRRLFQAIKWPRPSKTKIPCSSPWYASWWGHTFWEGCQIAYAKDDSSSAVTGRSLSLIQQGAADQQQDLHQFAELSNQINVASGHFYGKNL